MMQKRAGIFTVFAVVLTLLLSSAVWSAWQAKQYVPCEPVEEAYGLTDHGFDIRSVPTPISKDGLRTFLDHCLSAPELAQSPRFQYLLNQPNDPVLLEPTDVKMLYLYDGTVETVEETGASIQQAQDEGYFSAAFLMETADGGCVYTSTPYDRYSTTQEDLQKDYDEWVRSNCEMDS